MADQRYQMISVNQKLDDVSDEVSGFQQKLDALQKAIDDLHTKMDMVLVVHGYSPDAPVEGGS